MVIYCSIGDEKLCFNDVNEMYNFSGFEEIRFINCASNDITGILRLPQSLVQLQCENNKIEKFDNIPNHLKVLHCDNNEITELDDLPISITSIHCDKNKIEKITLPINIKFCSCENNKIRKLTNIPHRTIIICDDYVELDDDIDNNQILPSLNRHTYIDFLNDKGNEDEILKLLHISNTTNQLNLCKECIICNTKCEKVIKLGCNAEHIYCLKCFINWYIINKHAKRCCICFTKFKIDECIYSLIKND